MAETPDKPLRESEEAPEAREPAPIKVEFPQMPAVGDTFERNGQTWIITSIDGNIATTYRADAFHVFRPWHPDECHDCSLPMAHVLHHHPGAPGTTDKGGGMGLQQAIITPGGETADAPDQR